MIEAAGCDKTAIISVSVSVLECPSWKSFLRHTDDGEMGESDIEEIET